jgi:acetate kinase
VRVLVVNAGSSSLKLRVLDPQDEVVAAEDLPPLEGPETDDAVQKAIGSFGSIDAVGHRIVHGGSDFRTAVIVDDEVERRLRALVDLAPLHLPGSLAALAAVRAALPQAPAVACFDTAFHGHLPAAAATYALPTEWRRRWDLRRFGFHGLSHASASRRAAQLMGRPVERIRIVTCHLGAGASLAAVLHGRSVDTTMGFTPLEGLVMATRSGSVDPGLVLWLLEHGGMQPSEVAAALEERSGLAGLAGTPDMRRVLELEAAGDENARLAIDVYLHRLRAGIAAMAAAMDGLDCLVFTGGVGENAPPIRLRAASGLGFLGVGVDEARNDAVRPDAEVTADGPGVRTFVIRAREDVEIAREVRRLLAEDRAAPPR